MYTHIRSSLSLSCLLIAFSIATISSAVAQPPAPNSDATYQQLRNVTLSGDAVGVTNLTLKRDAGTFHLKSGTICFLAPVRGKVTGALFTGDGNLVLDPPSATERRSLSYLTRDSEFVEAFDHMVMRFTDDSYNEIKKASSGASGSCAPQLLQDNLQT